MHSFQKLWQVIKEDTDSSETSAMRAIRNGIGIRDQFWDDFLLLLNSAEAVADLFDVPVEKVSTWHDSIKKNLEKVHNSDSEIVPKDKKRLLKTGLPEGI